MIPCLTLNEDEKAMAAQHLVCKYLVRACREAMYDLALDEESDPEVRHEAIRVLKVVHQDWLEAQKAVANVSLTNGRGGQAPSGRNGAHTYHPSTT